MPSGTCCSPTKSFACGFNEQKDTLCGGGRDNLPCRGSEISPLNERYLGLEGEGTTGFASSGLHGYQEFTDVHVSYSHPPQFTYSAALRNHRVFRVGRSSEDHPVLDPLLQAGPTRKLNQVA